MSRKQYPLLALAACVIAVLAIFGSSYFKDNIRVEQTLYGIRWSEDDSTLAESVEIRVSGTVRHRKIGREKYSWNTSTEYTYLDGEIYIGGVAAVKSAIVFNESNMGFYIFDNPENAGYFIRLTNIGDIVYGQNADSGDYGLTINDMYMSDLKFTEVAIYYISGDSEGVKYISAPAATRDEAAAITSRYLS